MSSTADALRRMGAHTTADAMDQERADLARVIGANAPTNVIVRAPPAAGQVRAGPAARFNLRDDDKAR